MTQTNESMFSNMRTELKNQFDKMVDNPIDFNRLYEHIGLLTGVVDTLIQVVEQTVLVGDDADETGGSDE